ncbi:MAG TPA: GNAT family N-acetyltransferase [Candidatus Limnocylindrales bacterium]|nr:GNAT family N-acetyltransferase [Candidatus Limnocylindrales bacterium]
MRIRQATLPDARRIAQIHVASWQAAYRGQMPDAVLDKLDVEKRAAFWHTHLTRLPPVTFVAEFKQEIVGFCDLIPSRDKDSNSHITAEIAAIYVHPDYWRRGAGRALCLHALLAARHQHFTAVTLWVLAANVATQHFYLTMGFQVDGAAKSESFGDLKLQEVRFRIRL